MNTLRTLLARKLKLETAHYALAYTPNSSNVAVGPWPDDSGWSNGLKYVMLGYFDSYRTSSFRTRSDIVMQSAFHAIVRDKVDPDSLHNALLNLREYRESISPDLLEMNHATLET